MHEEYLKAPKVLKDSKFRADSFANGEVLHNKKKNVLPPMGWNSWNAFGSGNTEALTKVMADKIIELGLDKLGYQYVVLDDGCYKSERIDGRLSNEEVKFPSGFRALADYIHEKGLKFGMYNDIGTNLCAGAAVGTCGHEDEDAQSYTDWAVDFLKVDNCYYLWDNATFSAATNAKYVFAPAIKSVEISADASLSGAGVHNDDKITFSAVNDCEFTGQGLEISGDFVKHIGSFDGTGPGPSPVGAQSGELVAVVNSDKACKACISLVYASGEEEGIGRWLQLAVENADGISYIYDDFLEESPDKDTFITSKPIEIELACGVNKIRIMNHRRQENTLGSYAALLEELNRIQPDNNIILSICEWGKTSPQNWGYKVGDSWRILNDITFRVGADGDPGVGSWKDDYTPSVTSQYNKAVIMDEFSGLAKGWNDPDMLMVGMNGLTLDMNKTHMAMWCMMNSPLMLGLDLRRVNADDELDKIISNKLLISFNQDALGIQAKRVKCSLAECAPDKTYIRDINRTDILAKPLSDGAVALSFINVSEEAFDGEISVNAATIVDFLKERTPEIASFVNAKSYRMIDVWTGEEIVSGSEFKASGFEACENKTYKVIPCNE